MKHRLSHLDFVRGLAALLVCLEHIRGFLLVPYAQLKSPVLIERFVYFVTGLGHQAVMVFFVLSGFLVGGSVISAHQQGRWTWSGYLLRRLTRLWVVLIPALLLTLLWDGLGQRLWLAGYHGAFLAAYHSGPAPDAPADLRWNTLLGNVFFLQTIRVNCYGTNGPLWSLANEFWYYLLLPLGWGIFKAGHLWRRLACALLVAALVVWLPGNILLGGLVWLMGAGIFVLIQSERGRRWPAHPLWLCAGGLLALTMLGASRMGKLGATDDLLVGSGFSVLVAALAVRPAKPGIYTATSAAASEVSYTLYLVHFPILALFFFAVCKGHQIQPGFAGAFWFLMTFVVVVLYAAGVWWCFERNTDRVRSWVQMRFQREPVGKMLKTETPKN